VCATVLIVGACSDPEYGADDARADLVAAGFDSGEADCVIGGLEEFFVDEFIALQEAEGLGDVSQAQIDNYVRNRFADEGAVTLAASAETEWLVAECRR